LIIAPVKHGLSLPVSAIKNSDVKLLTFLINNGLAKDPSHDILRFPLQQYCRQFYAAIAP